MYVFTILLIIIFISSLVGIIEFTNHQKRIYSIPIRIHVNGTRGKSSVTRLIGAGLREGSINTITKVTGTYPRLILNDGSEISVYRKAEANIIEQLSIVKYSYRQKARALVMECMALQPLYQSITEEKMIHSTIGVITNVRLDHVDIMGYTIPEIADVIGRTIPKNKILFTAELENTAILKKLADKKNVNMYVTDPQSVTDEEMIRFTYIEHKENVALAIAICGYVGVDRETALRGMYKAEPDAGVLRLFTVNIFNKAIRFYNAFAANDPQSTLMIWQIIKNKAGFKGKRIVLLNTRHDRMDRAEQLAQMLGKNLQEDFDYVLLMGQSTDVVEDLLISNGIAHSKIINLGWIEPQAIFEKVLSFTDNESTVVAIGNMGGMGGKLVEYFENRSTGNG
jgi:poly-gamma-glutamate synthase PgsB/CapB